MMNKNTLILVLVASLALSLGLFAQHQFKKPVSLLDFSLPDLSGKSQPIQQWQAKIQVINFWATWCPSCLKEMRDFIELQQQYKNHNVQFIGIAVDNEKAVKTYLSKLAINYPILIAGDNGMQLAKRLGNKVGAIPFTLIVNPKGDIVHRQLGEISKTQLMTFIQPLLEQKPTNKQ